MTPRAAVVYIQKTECAIILTVNAITIPKNNFVKVDMVMLPRTEYEELCARPPVREFIPTKSDLRALTRMRKNRVAGKLISLDVLKRDLASRR